MQIMSKQECVSHIPISEILNQLEDQIRNRIHHPTVITFFEIYLEAGLHTKTVELISALSEEAQAALVTTLQTHVHKEKPVFISKFGTQLNLEKEQVASIAIAVDLLWAISLMYDDMFDGDTVRSGIPTVWCTYGKEQTVKICFEIFAAILSDLTQHVGSQIASLAKNYVQRGLDSLAKHSQLSLTTTVEELYQNYQDRNDFNGTFGMHALVELAKQQSLEVDAAAIDFIKNLNLASQLLNDLKDIDDFYNRGYSDIRNGVVTVPISDLYMILSEEEQQTFLKMYGSKRDLTGDDKEFIVKVVDTYDVASNTVKRILAHYATAEEIARNLLSQDDFTLVQSWIAYKKEPLQRYA